MKPPGSMKAVVLLTCFNRREKTLSCLKSIYGQSKVNGLSLKIYLVDDGSTDGTSSAVARDYPEVSIIKGNGNLYWNGGMNIAWKAAAEEGFDYYIWINDDVSLVPDAISVLFDAYQTVYEELGVESVIVGSFHESGSDRHAYGGFDVKKTIWGIVTSRIIPDQEIKKCDTFNGNLVLIPDSVVKKVGFLDERYTHSFGDKDYGYRCMSKNIPMYIAPGYVGECSRNAIEGVWFNPNASLRERYKTLIQPTGLPPAEYFYSFKKNSNYLAGGIALLKVYFRLVFPKFWVKLSRSQDGE